MNVLLQLGVFAIIAASVSGQTDKVVCYYGSWSFWRTGEASFKPDQIDTSVCTHVIYAFVGADITTGNVTILIDNFKIFNDIKLKNPSLKTLVAVGGYNEGSYKYSVIAANPVLRANFIQSALDLCQSNNFDGFDLDWEYPGRRGGSTADKENFVTLIKELKEVFSKNGLLVTAAVAATASAVDISYDVPSLSTYLDFINVMAYDLHGFWDGVLGHNAPMYPSAVDLTAAALELNVQAIVEAWISRGADPQKLVLGIGAYGRSFTLSDTSLVTVGSPITGVGNAAAYTQEGGILAYLEVVLYQLEGGWTVMWDDVQAVPYMYKDNQWITYDDPKSVAIKTSYAQSKNLGGVMIWSIEIEDFNGRSGVPYPLLNAIKETLNSSNNADEASVVDAGASASEASTKAETAKASATIAAVTEAATTAAATEAATTAAVTEAATSAAVTEAATTAAATEAATTAGAVDATATAATSSVVVTCNLAGITRDANDCSKFYKCVLFGSNLVLYTKQCPSGLYYDYSCNCCNYPSAVADCS